MKALTVIETVIERIGRAVAWLALSMVLVMLVIVILRYLFNEGSIKLQESVIYFHSAVFLLGAAYTLQQDGHVRVDIFYRGMSECRRALVDACGVLFLLLPTCLFVFLVSLPYVSASWRLFEGSREPGGLPGVFLLKTMIPVAMALLILQGLALLVRAVRRYREGERTPAADHR